MEKVRVKHIEDITLKNSSATTLQSYLRRKKCCLNTTSTYSMQQFFTLKLDTHKNNKTEKPTKFRDGNTRVKVQGKPGPSLRNGTVQF